MRKKFGKFFVVIGAVLIALSVALAVYNYIENVNSARSSEEVMAELKQKISGEAESQGMKVVEIDGYGYIGYLYMPSLELELPIMSEWDYDRLKIAPCLYYGSVKTDDMVIAGHNYTRHFGRLNRLKIGDTVQFTDMEGNVYKYKVGDMETLQPSDTEDMIISDWDLSLYTCTLSGGSRITVRCERVSKNK